MKEKWEVKYDALSSYGYASISAVTCCTYRYSGTLFTKEIVETVNDDDNSLPSTDDELSAAWMKRVYWLWLEWSGSIWFNFTGFLEWSVVCYFAKFKYCTSLCGNRLREKFIILIGVTHIDLLRWM